MAARRLDGLPAWSGRMGAMAWKADWRGAGWALGAALAAVSAPAAAQSGGELPPLSQPMVQALPSRGSMDLNAALTRLAANPRDLGALIDAGSAALALGDTDAALGFFTRADQLAPGNPQVKAALARAMVRSENPFGAIPLFAAAERAGANDAMFAADRGLAYDLVGDNVTAQRYYRQAQAGSGDPEIGRRLALSFAIAGNRRNAEAVLVPQLQRNDRAGWRTRAFMLAILGDTEEAVRVAYATMPRDLADGMAAYLRYMPRLTPAQQAAAANFGHFPRAAQIGRDDPRVLQYAAASPRPPRPDAAQASAAQTSGGKAKSAAAATRKSRESRRDRERQARAAAAPVRVASAAATRPAAAQPPAVAAAQPVRAAVQPSAPAVPTATAPAAQPPVRIAAATPVPVPAAMPPAMSAGVAQFGQPVSAVPAAPGSAGPPAASAAPALVLPSPAGPAQATPAQVSSGTGVPVPASEAAPSNLDLARAAQQPPARALTASSPPATGQPTEPAPAATLEPRNLAAAFSGFLPPAEEQAAPSAAVDITKIPAPRPRQTAAPADRGPAPGAPSASRRTVMADPAAPTPKASAKTAAAKTGKTKADAADAADKPKAKAAAPSHPSRIWVQVGVGRDKSALAFDWRKATRESAELLKGKKAWTTPWGQTNRLLVGPFETQAAAQAFLKQWKDKDAGAFVWTSPAGQAVDALVAK
jgi:Flp pilus assembly protein TadD